MCDCGGEDKRFQITGEQLTAAEAAGGAQAALFLGRSACFRWPLNWGGQEQEQLASINGLM